MSNLYTFHLFQSQYKNDSDRNRILDVNLEFSSCGCRCRDHTKVTYVFLQSYFLTY